ncbi:hypothetical protein DEI93_12170 [Curtobacterium sp. MCBD17_035]|uniref:hypothetical protein n=1 Tax=Curtobacterium sp. MCBD17_035 TaxID=2175673 RepID=UPI000DA767F6|nr:hypothetical protein [Curtobacterium sp. MCBD17_035]WIB66713.1 hypothetical protein DEI93_12170 [Curtobacterium sp. MCBD17_035]
MSVPHDDPVPFRLVAPAMRRFAVALWIVAVALVPIGLITDGPRALLLVPAPSAFTAWFAWTALWRPRVLATADGVVVVDVRRTTRIAWGRVLEVRSRFGLEVVTSEGDRRTWIAPRPTARLRLTPVAPLGPGGPAQAAETTLTVAEAADRLRAFVPSPAPLEGPPPAEVTPARIEHRVHGWSVVALIALGLLGSMAGARI